MITLITGQPGAGKTLYTVSRIRAEVERDGRQVYYSGIADLKLPWVELEDATEWHTLPAGAVVVIDEAQRVFRPRGNGATVPLYVSALETHRHQGIDLYIITQHPMLVDTNVRRLVGRHLHVVRRFGTKSATVHEWGEVKTECDKSRSDSLRHAFSYPVEAFAVYKSAEVHTHKARIPARLWLFFVLPVLIFVLGYLAVRMLSSRSSSPVVPMPGAASLVTASASPVLSSAEYFSRLEPRVVGLPHTAPVYDQVTEPRLAPHPAACISGGGRCSCYTDQATRIDVPHDLCSQIVERGYFVSWASNGGSGHFPAKSDRVGFRQE